MRRPISTITTVLLAATLAAFAGCAANESGGAAGGGAGEAADGTGFGPRSDAGGTSGGSTDGSDTGIPPEQEEEFEFSAPAVVGGSIYVANETLNSVAVIDSNTLSIDSLLAGFRPTEIVGPEPAHADSDAARVMALNEGSSSVTVIDPENGETENLQVMAKANAIEMDPTGRYGVVWYDTTRQKKTDDAGDLSAVTVVTEQTTHRVAVGFHVRDVIFDDSGERALVWSDDGISLIDLSNLSGDTVAPPVSLVPDALDVFQPEDLEIKTTADASYVVTRSARMRGVVLLDVDERKHHVVPMFEVPTDVDLIGGDTSQILVMLRQSNRAVRADVPGGLVDASDELQQYVDDVPVPDQSSSGHLQSDAGVTDTGTSDATSSDTSLADTTATDTSAADTGVADTATADTATADTTATDTGPADTSTTDGGGDADTMGPTGTLPSLQNFRVVDVQIDNLGAATVGKTAETALLYTTVQEEKRVILFDLTDDSQNVIALKKKVRGAITDQRGQTFIIYNQKQPGDIPPDASPNSEEYLARHWGVTLLDVESQTKKLILTKKEPGPTAIWSAEQGDSKIYFTFTAPAPNVQRTDPAYRDLVEVNLDTFRERRHRLPSIPEGLGPIQPARKIFVSQRHPQGRMTFIDVRTAERQTITGYQLNSRIE